jgi:hypothetical protein
MALGDYRILPGLVTEEIGQEILVCDTDLAVVHRVSGPAADVLRQVLATGGEPVALEGDDITSGLVAAGVLVSAEVPADLVSRRSFVSAAAAVGAIGIVTLALPRAAAASSTVDPSLVPPPPPPEPDPVVQGFRTQITYPDLDAPENELDRTARVFWGQTPAGSGGGAFTYQVTITGSLNSFNPIVRTFSSGVQNSVFIPEWKVGETITGVFVTTSLATPVSGDTRTTMRTG